MQNPHRKEIVLRDKPGKAERMRSKSPMQHDEKLGCYPTNNSNLLNFF